MWPNQFRSSNDFAIETHSNECGERRTDEAENDPGYSGIQPQPLKTGKQEEMRLEIDPGCVITRVGIAVQEVKSLIAIARALSSQAKM